MNAAAGPLGSPTPRATALLLGRGCASRSAVPRCGNPEAGVHRKRRFYKARVSRRGCLRRRRDRDRDRLRAHARGRLAALGCLGPHRLRRRRHGDAAHRFWQFDAAQLANQLNPTHFLKNLAVIGGLLFVVSFGPGRMSIDKT